MHMENLSSSDPSHHAMYENSDSKHSQDGLEDGSRWYFSRKELEEYSPSKLDGIDLKKETYLRKLYCTFLQDLGMRLKVPQVTIATAIIFCHRFFLRQSHAKNDRRTIATVCMFLAGKVEETPRPLKDVILVSYEIINKKDATAAQRIKQKVSNRYEVSNQMLELYEQNRLPPSGEADGSIGGGPTIQTPSKAPTNSEECAVMDNHVLGAGDQTSRAIQNQSIESSSVDFRSPSNHKTGSESKVRQEMEPAGFHDKGLIEQSHGSDMKINETRDAMELKDKHVSRNIDFREGTLGKSQAVIKMIDKDKVKAALEKRRKSLGSMTQKKELMDEDDLIERELEAGVEMAAGSEKTKREQRQIWNKSSNKQEHEDLHQERHREEDRGEHLQRTRQSYDLDSGNMEEGEFSTGKQVGYGYHESPKANSRKRGRELTG